MKPDNAWKEWIAVGLCCFLILIGVGGCKALIDYGDSLVQIHKPK